MKHFQHLDALTLQEAALEKANGAQVLAGGTDLLGTLKDKVTLTYPEKIVNIKKVPGMDQIEESDTGIRIGANVHLADLAASEKVKAVAPAVADAAYSVATPLIRNLATLGGNLCQDTRCWYYRYPHQIGGRIDCARKDGEKCWAMTGENKFHSIFGGMRVHASACTMHCPAHVDVPQYLEKVRKGDLDGAAKILLRKNPLAAVTSRVCAHFCMQGCRRDDYDQEVNIGQIERYVGDYILENADRLMPPPETETGKTVGIIGAGPTALTAAYYLRKAGHAVTVLDKMEEPGGLLMYAIPEYRLPKDKVRQLASALRNMGVEFRQKVEVGVDIQVDEVLGSFDSVLLDTGAWKRNVIGIDGEDLTTFGLDFLVEVKRWMKDKPGSKVIVVGGGNVAVDVAVTAKRLGAATVTMVSRKLRKDLSATPEEIERAVEEGVVHEGGWVPVEVLREGNSVKGMKFKKNPLLGDESETMVVDGDAILLAVGQQIDLSYLDERLALATEKGRIAIEQSQMTSQPGVFAGGDATTGPSTVVAAMDAGHRAADSISKYLTGETLQEEPFNEHFIKRGAGSLRHTEQVKANLLPREERSADREDDLGLPLEKVQQEANRCFNCACYAVSPSDLATVLMALHAKINTNKNIYDADSFFTRDTKTEKLLGPDEIVVSVEIPKTDAVTAYDKYRERESIDFAIIGLGSELKAENGVITRASLVLGAVAPVPVRATEAEAYLIGKTVSEAVAQEAADIAMKDAEPLEQNSYKVQLAKTLIKRAILRVK